MPAIGTDLYIIRDGSLTFRDQDLADTLAARLEMHRPVILEGILVLETLDRLGSILVNAGNCHPNAVA